MTTDRMALHTLRTIAITLSLAIGFGAFLVFMQIGSADGLETFDVVRAVLILISTTWLAWGGIQGLLGLTTHPSTPSLNRAAPIQGRTVVIMPVYNEDPLVSFSRLAAMDQSLKETGVDADIHFAILSDSRDPRHRRSGRAAVRSPRRRRAGGRAAFSIAAENRTPARKRATSRTSSSAPVVPTNMRSSSMPIA